MWCARGTSAIYRSVRCSLKTWNGLILWRLIIFEIGQENLTIIKRIRCRFYYLKKDCRWQNAFLLSCQLLVLSVASFLGHVPCHFQPLEGLIIWLFCFNFLMFRWTFRCNLYSRPNSGKKTNTGCVQQSSWIYLVIYMTFSSFALECLILNTVF